MAHKPAIRTIPGPLWGLNLRTKIPKSRWAKIRQDVLGEHDPICETCGKVETDGKRLYVHEDWEYEASCKPAVAHLKRLVLSCWHCHAVEHFGRTAELVRSGVLTGQAIEDTINHFCRVNQVGRDEFRAHSDDARAEWTKLSKLEWVVDWGPFEALVLSYQGRRAASG